MRQQRTISPKNFPKPVVLAGGGGGTIKGGQAYDLSADPNRKLCRLHLALMDRMGVRVDRFGDAENALAI